MNYYTTVNHLLFLNLICPPDVLVITNRLKNNTSSIIIDILTRATIKHMNLFIAQPESFMFDKYLKP